MLGSLRRGIDGQRRSWASAGIAMMQMLSQEVSYNRTVGILWYLLDAYPDTSP
jgi:hypothetical protein